MVKKLLLLTLFFSTLFSSDRDKVYQNSSEIEIEIIQNRSFKVTRKDGAVLRKPSFDEKFFIDRSNNQLKINYNITKKIGGVDINYSIYNPTSKPQSICDFTVDGLTFTNSQKSRSLNILNTLNFQYMHKRSFNESLFSENGYFNINGVDLVYPIVYSPVIVSHDGSYSVGSSLNFSYIKELLEPHLRIYRLQNGTFRHAYERIKNRKLLPGKSLNLTLSIRFASPKNWIYTLYPYKNFFNTIYGEQRDIVQKNLNPISGILLSYSTASQEYYSDCKNQELNCDDNNKNILKYNLFGYNSYIRPDLYGLDGPNPNFNNRRFISEYIQKLKLSGYKRTMIWAVSGQYWRCPKNKIQKSALGLYGCSTNYPPQFISSPSLKVQNSLDTFKKFKEANISLGLWWGRAGQVPYPIRWNPDTINPLNPLNRSHRNFMLDELKLAYLNGANEIGLDAFVNMEAKNQLAWLRLLKKITKKEIKFWSEGSVSDFLHTQTSAFLQPKNEYFSYPYTEITNRAKLMDYLNPNAEVIVYFPNKVDNISYIQNLINWGYTPLILAHPNIFEKPLVDIKSIKVQ